MTKIRAEVLKKPATLARLNCCTTNHGGNARRTKIPPRITRYPRHGVPRHALGPPAARPHRKRADPRFRPRHWAADGRFRRHGPAVRLHRGGHLARPAHGQSSGRLLHRSRYFCGRVGGGPYFCPQLHPHCRDRRCAQIHPRQRRQR